MQNATVKIISTNIEIIVVADKAPVLPNSNVAANALGISATIPENIISDIPLPIPLCVICSPSWDVVNATRSTYVCAKHCLMLQCAFD